MDPRRCSQWSVPVGPDGTGSVHVDASTGSVYLADGWSVAPRARSLRRLDAQTGTELARVRTRSRTVTALLISGGELVVGTPGRLLRLDPLTLEVRATVEFSADVLPSSLGREGGQVAVAVPYSSSLLVVDLQTGAVRRRRGRSGQTVRQFGSEARIYNAQEATWRRINVDSGTLDCRPSPAAVVDVAVDRTIWGIPTGTSLGGGLPSWGFSPAAGVVRLEPAGAEWPLPERVTGLAVMDVASELWVVSGFSGQRLLRVDQHTGVVLTDLLLSSGKVAALAPQVGAMLVDVPESSGHRAHWCQLGS